jgi:hypothetical protein
MSSVLGDHHRFEPGPVFMWMHSFGRTKSGATAYGAAAELLQLSRNATTEGEALSTRIGLVKVKKHQRMAI